MSGTSSDRLGEVVVIVRVGKRDRTAELTRPGQTYRAYVAGLSPINPGSSSKEATVGAARTGDLAVLKTSTGVGVSSQVRVTSSS